VNIICICAQWSAESEAQEEGTKWLEGLLEIMAEGIMAGTHSKCQSDRISDRRNCKAETAGAKQMMDIWDGEQISI